MAFSSVQCSSCYLIFIHQRANVDQDAEYGYTRRLQHLAIPLFVDELSAVKTSRFSTSHAASSNPSICTESQSCCQTTSTDGNYSTTLEQLSSVRGSFLIARSFCECTLRAALIVYCYYTITCASNDSNH